MNDFLEIAVEAKVNSVSNGVGKSAGRLQVGTILKITCSPDERWSIGPSYTNANGDLQGPSFTKNNQTFSSGSLVGSLNGGLTFFSIGTFLQMTITERDANGQDPELLLYCWDSDNVNNHDYIGVIVEKFSSYSQD